ncbi:MAG: restriction endonuclease subunit S [Proteobacteria bacterium]|nr:restriction endonuclease subunit S [Pseudomonadota bacterium]
MTRINITDNRKEEIPKNWSITELGALLVQITNGLTTKQSKEPPGIPVTRIETISYGTVDLSRVRYITDIDEDKKEKFLLRRGDILFSHINSDFHLGKTAIVTTNRPLLHGMNLLLLRTDHSCLDSYYLHYLCNYYRFAGKFVEIAQHAVNQSSLNQKKIKSLNIPLAPLNEQKRIVAEIEKQFSRLDEAVDNLKRVKANLHRYKASVLKAAVEGRLTEEWMAAHPDVEPAEKLLERILAERRKKWEEAELAKMKKAGKEPKDGKWKKKYKEPEMADQIDMEMPDGWVSATVKQLAERVQYGSSSKTNEDSVGIPLLRMGNIFEGKLLLDKLKYLPESHDEFPELLLEPDDLLFNRTNSPELVGKTAVYKGNPSPCSFASYLIRARFINGVDPNFISYFINSNYGRKWIKSVVSQQVGQANVNGTKLQALSVPLPPYIEQCRIVSNVENKFSIIDGIEKEVDRNLIRADRLRQSILKKAFSGKLLV